MGLRETKKQATRRRISDTATTLFLERGFDTVTVAEIAAACGVSEKTVFNYFPTKESLLLDREADWTAAIRAALEPGAPIGSPVEAMVAAIMAQWDQMAGHGATLDLTRFHRVAELIHGTASVRAANEDMTRRIVGTTAEILAQRAGVDPDEPEPQIAADALVGLWRVHFRSLRRHADGSRSPVELRERVLADVRRAARLIDAGLWSFGLTLADIDQLPVSAPIAVRAERARVVAQLRRLR